MNYAESAIDEQELQTVFSNQFTRFERVQEL